MDQRNGQPHGIPSSSSSSRPNGQYGRQKRFAGRPNGQEYGSAAGPYHQAQCCGPPDGQPGQSSRSRNYYRSKKKPFSGTANAFEAAAPPAGGSSAGSRRSRDESGAASAQNTCPSGATSAPADQNVSNARSSRNRRPNTGSRSDANPRTRPLPFRPPQPPPRPSRVALVDTGDPESQRKKLEELLKQGSCECMICCEEISSRDSVWNCFSSCYNIFHLRCISTWACANIKSTENGDTNPGTSAKKGWRCPTCQTVVNDIPNYYFCFCGKKRNPEVFADIIPHSCGQVCLKRKNTAKNSRCVHRCQLLCHPGACPPCDIGIRQDCACGRTSKPVACGASDRDLLTCDSVCGKSLNCQKHTCDRTCHPGPCDPCGVEVVQKCFCEREQRKLLCGSQLPQDTLSRFSCHRKCHKKLSCDQHLCKQTCHDGPCSECKLQPGVVDSCPCGKMPIDSFGKERINCTDPLPVCGSVCGKTLRCGPLNDPHRCSKNCHNGTCGPCKLKTSIQCRCAATNETIECKTLKDRVFICNRRCNKKMSCGRHKCQKSCCKKDDGHVCTMICQKRLSCGQHKCSEVCHPGSCQTCWNVSWQELTCRCGQEVVLPPISCGTKIPVCSRPCNRPHPCSHPVDHNCHQEQSCPPCTYGTRRSCFGNHTTMNNVLCCLPGVSCGKQCGRKMRCAVHVCQRACHQGSCGDCNYSCTKVRPCGHLCNQTCHELAASTCPAVPCRVMLTVYCSCKRLSDKRSCDEINHQNHRLPMTLLARLKIANDSEIDVSTLIREGEAHKFIRLECDAKCNQIERNRNLADALSIKDPEVNPDAGVRYPESLKQAFLHYPDFVRETYTTLSQLVKATENMRNNYSMHNFPAMRQDLRAIVHELAEVFKCKSHSVDLEPNRSVVVKVFKEKSAVPAQSLMDAMRSRVPAKAVSNFTTLVKSNPSGGGSKAAPVPKPAVAKKDYFDFDGDD